MAKDNAEPLTGEILEEEIELTLTQLCRSCQMPAESIHELIEAGVIEPVNRDPRQWRFRGICVRRVQRARRLQHDLGVNPAGAALILDLLEELHALRRRLARLEG